MRTLRPWVSQLTNRLRRIDCAEMLIYIGRDDVCPSVRGTGEVSFEDECLPRFTVNIDNYSQHSLIAIHDEAADFRLVATDHFGTEWHCGWVHPTLTTSGDERLQVVGHLQRITTHPRASEDVSQERGIELYFDPAPRIPLSEAMHTQIRFGTDCVFEQWGAGRERFEHLGSQFEIFRDPQTGGLWVTATTSNALEHPWFEGSVFEPLQLLTGKLLYPRLVARNLGNGDAQVSLSRIYPLRSTIGGLAPTSDRSDFWGSYRSCLVYVTKHRRMDVLAPCTLTLLHHEIIQASTNSNWVFSLALASATEGLIRLAVDETQNVPEFSPADIDAAKKAVSELPPKLRDRLCASIGHLARPSPRSQLKALAAAGHITNEQVTAWNTVRNRVAHGVLHGVVEEPDNPDELLRMVELAQGLTKYIIAREAPTSDA